MPVPAAAAAASASFGQALGQSAASSGVTGLISGALGQLFGGMNARRQWRFQQKQMKLQQKYALEQMQKQSELSYANWQRQFDYENAYNDPTKVFDRYLKAGVTPAAVLGSSGVGVNATIPGGSAPMPSASGPAGGSPVAPGSFASTDPTSIAQNMIAQSAIHRNDAAANRDEAEAANLRGNTHTQDWRERMDRLELQIAEHHVKDARELANLREAQAQITAIDAYLATITQGYKMSSIMAMAGILEEKYQNIRLTNDWFAPQAGAALAVAWSSAIANVSAAAESESRIKLNAQELKDLQNWYELNWEKEVPVQIRNDKGEVIDTKVMKVAETTSILKSAAAEAAQLETGNARWDLRNSRLRLAHDVVRSFATAAGIAGASYVGRKAAGPAGPEGYEEFREVYGPSGTPTGSTYTRRNYHGRN
nr:MAG TPA: DNA pilot protein VP2 [Microviridae sp.]